MTGTLTLHVRASDGPDLRKRANELSEGAGEGTACDAIVEAVGCAFRSPVDTGYEIVRRGGWWSEAGAEASVMIRMRVNDPTLLLEEAARRRQETKGSAGWRASSIGEALHEVLVASGGGPAPEAYGIRHLNWKWAEEAPDVRAMRGSDGAVHAGGR